MAQRVGNARQDLPGRLLRGVAQGHAVHALVVEVAEAGQSSALDSPHPGARIHWLLRDAHATVPGTLLEAAVRAATLADTARVYVGCEAAALRRIRRYLLQERQLPATQVTTRGYWKLGETDHPDRDFGEDA